MQNRLGNAINVFNLKIRCLKIKCIYVQYDKINIFYENNMRAHISYRSGRDILILFYRKSKSPSVLSFCINDNIWGHYTGTEKGAVFNVEIYKCERSVLVI